MNRQYIASLVLYGKLIQLHLLHMRLLILSLSKMILFACVLTSCKRQQKYPNAIHDFKYELQPHLVDIITQGYVNGTVSFAYIGNHASKNDLYRLTLSEHPLLRSAALHLLLERDDIDHFALIMSHLDDTALVMDGGQSLILVSDKMVSYGKWKNREERQKTIDKLVMSHNYLNSAYYALGRIEPLEKYYPAIRTMATRDRPIGYLEYAWYALAQYKKKEDIPFIRDRLLQHSRVISDKTLKLMMDYPDSSYLDILELFGRERLYRNSNWINFNYSKFFNTLSSFKNKRSAALLNSIYYARLKPRSLSEARLEEEIKLQLALAIEKNNCPLYSRLFNTVKPLLQQYHHENPPLFPESNPYFISGDTSFISWWRD